MTSQTLSVGDARRRAGRAAELARLVAALRRGLGGPAAVAAVAGPAGIGKTWLLDRAVAAATDGGPAPLVLRASGHPAERTLPFAALHQLVQPVLGAFDRLPPPQRSALEAALAMADLTPRDRFAAGSGLHRLLANLADGRPTLVVVDDAHWLDASSREALTFAVRRLDADRVAVVVAGRAPGALGLGRPDAEAVTLGPLDDEAARALVRDQRPEVTVPTLDAVVQAAGGLPLALREIPAELTDDQLRSERPLPRVLPLGPRSTGLYERRLAALDRDAAMALLVTGLEPLDRTQLGRALGALGLPADALDPAERLGLVAVDGHGARVTHPTIAAAVDQRATDGDRRRVHGVLAEVLADRPSQRATHLAALTAGLDTAVAEAFAAAGRDAERRSAWLLAGQAYRAAADRCPPTATAPGTATRTGTGTAAGLALATSTSTGVGTGGGGDRRRQHLAKAAEAFARAGASTPLLAALGELAHGATGAGERLHAEADLLAAQVWAMQGPIDAEAVRSIADRDGGAAPVAAARLLTVLGLGLVISGRPGEVAAHLAAAKRLAGPAPADHEVVLSWDIIDLHLGGSGGDVLGGDWAERLPDAALCAPSLPVVSATSSLIWADALDRAEGLLLRQRDASLAAGAVGHLGLCDSLLGAVAVRRGDWGLAQERFAAAIDLCADTDMRGPLPHIQSRSGYLQAARGDAAACRLLFDDALASSGGSPVVAHLEACALGLLALGEGRCREAADLLHRAGALEDVAGVRQPGYSSRAGDLADALWRLRDLPGLHRLVAEVEGRARRADRAGPLATAARCRALVVEPDAIDAAFGRAEERHRDAPDAFEEARTQLSWGRRLRLARRRRDARPHLSVALDAFERLGAVPWAAQARSELVACGERRGSGPAASARLTPRELEVAVAVAGGASNPETAAELCISRRTVEDHLGRVYRKLGVADRTALAEALAAARPG